MIVTLPASIRTATGAHASVRRRIRGKTSAVRWIWSAGGRDWSACGVAESERGAWEGAADAVGRTAATLALHAWFAGDNTRRAGTDGAKDVWSSAYDVARAEVFGQIAEVR